MQPYRRRWSVVAVLGAVLGSLAGAGLVAATSGAGVEHPRSGIVRLEATHLPPLLTAAGEAVTLRYDIYCVGSDEPGASCDAGGAVFARAKDSGPFEALPLRFDPSVVEGRYAVRMPEALARSGFTYYAVLRDARSGASTTLPAGGAGAFERSAPLGPSSVIVRLGRHVFGAVRAADERVASAPWGSGTGAVGLEERGPDATPIGASAFDVDSSGRVVVLDEANRRLLRWAPGASLPAAVPVSVSGTIADLASGDDGAAYVLESARGSVAVLRTFDGTGAERAAVDVGTQASAVRSDSSGPVVLDPQSGRWLSPGQAERGRVGRPAGAGLRVVVYRAEPGELRVATVNESGAVVRGWRIESETPIGEVQLADPIGGKLVLALRIYTEAQAEFAVLVLGGAGIERQFSLDASAWAETAPLGRFRLAGGSLYRLGSTPAGVFVDRYDLGVT